MDFDYDASRFGPRMSIIVLTGTFQTVKRDPKLNAEPHQYAYGTASVDVNFLTMPRNGLSSWASMFARRTACMIVAARSDYHIEGPLVQTSTTKPLLPT
jgi:hypothetical protein